MAAAEAGNARHLLIFLDQRVGLPVDVRDRNLNRDFALGGALFRSTLPAVTSGVAPSLISVGLTVAFPVRLRQQSREGIAPLRRVVPQT